jgi:[ribosomal protein S5]-alanine N-acetyltransferase
MNIEIQSPIVTERLILRRPEHDDARQVFENYASDPEVVKYMAWRRHETLQDSQSFVDNAVEKWNEGRGGGLLVCDPKTEEILGSTGIIFERPGRAIAGYVFRRSAWGKGYATEALEAVVDLAALHQAQRIYAHCHFEHRASARVMEKCGFEYEGTLRRHIEFPNISPGRLTDVHLYAWITPNA